jgi:serine phosphatase RsbU (regulator of sigma subunit)/anti-sigma regulatory factor (Ser/Thr protein kinase)
MTMRRYVPLAVLVAVLALVALAGVLAWRQYDDARLVEMNEVRAHVALGSAVVETSFVGDIATLKAVARAQAVVDGDQAGMLAYFRRVAPADRTLFPGGFAWIDAKGVSRVSSTLTKLAPPVDVSDRTYFTRVVASNAPYVSAGLVSRRSGLHVLVMAVPTHDATGKINGVLTGSLPLQLGATNQSTVDLGFQGLAILDRDGQSLLAGFTHPQNAALVARIQKTGSGSLSDSRGLGGGSGRVVVWSAAPIAGWSIVIDRTRSSVFSAARQAFVLDLSLIGGLALLVLALIAWMAQRARREARRQADHFDREHDIAVRLQRSMLPTRLPTVDSVELACRYRAGVAGVEVGGDWYDVVARADGFVHAIVGDVAGRGIEAATLMGQLRSAFHAYAYDHGSPAEVLGRMLRLVPEGGMATAVCLTLDPFTGELRYATAGHPPPVAFDGPTRSVSLLDIAGAPPLGYVAADKLVDARLVLAPGSTVVAYTDGLVERRSVSIDVGIDRLSAALISGADLSADELAGWILDEVGQTQASEEDDVALLVLRLVAVPSRLEIELAADATALAPLRRRLRTWLTLRGLEEQQREDAILAINEACSNSIEHGYDRASGLIRLTVEQTAGLLEIVVQDFGRWRARPAVDGARGRGIAIMRSVMQRAEIDSDEHGTTVSMAQSLTP